MNYTNKLSRICHEKIEQLNEDKIVLKWGYSEDTVGICTCTMNNFFAYSLDENDELRCYYLLGSLFDQIMYTHFQENYKTFRSAIKFPKIFAHGAGIMSSPSIFLNVEEIESREGNKFKWKPKKINWTTMKNVANNLLLDLSKWFKDTKNDTMFSSFKTKLLEEIDKEFSEPHKKKLIEIVNSK